MNMKRKRYGSYYTNSDLGDGQVDEWYERVGETTSNFLFCNQCYDKHGNALMTRKRMWFDDEPIGEMVEYDRPIYPEYISDEDVAWHEKNEPSECQKCDAPIREKRENMTLRKEFEEAEIQAKLKKQIALERYYEEKERVSKMPGYWRLLQKGNKITELE